MTIKKGEIEEKLNSFIFLFSDQNDVIIFKQFPN